MLLSCAKDKACVLVCVGGQFCSFIKSTSLRCRQIPYLPRVGVECLTAVMLPRGGEPPDTLGIQISFQSQHLNAVIRQLVQRFQVVLKSRLEHQHLVS